MSRRVKGLEMHRKNPLHDDRQSGEQVDGQQDPLAGGNSQTAGIAHCPSRRRFLSSTFSSAVKLGVVGATVGPWVVDSTTLASTSSVNVLMWEKYLPESWRTSFTDKTGIVVNFTAVGSNEEIINKMNATRGKGIDICSPTSDRSGQWADLELLIPWDLSLVPNVDGIYPRMMEVANTAWNFAGGGPHWLPHIWYAEGVGWRTDSYSPPEDKPSFGNIWTGEETAGKAMIRAHSGMLGAGLFMEEREYLNKGDVFGAYASEDRMRIVWDKIIEFCLERKQRIARLWDQNRDQREGFLEGNIVVGQMSDEPMFALKQEEQPVEFRAPVEGALAWIDGMSLSAEASNIDEAYEFVKFCYDPVPAGQAIAEHGRNSVVRDAVQHADAIYRTSFNVAYPGDSIERLNLLPFEPKWYQDLRTEYSSQLEQLFVDG